MNSTIREMILSVETRSHYDFFVYDITITTTAIAYKGITQVTSTFFVLFLAFTSVWYGTDEQGQNGINGN